MKFTLRNVILSYPHLDKPQQNKETPDAPPKYRASFLFPFSDEVAMKTVTDAVIAAYEEGRDDSKKAFPKLKTVDLQNIATVLKGKITFYDGVANKHGTYHVPDAELNPPELAGYAELRSSCNVDRPPQVVDAYGKRLSPEEIAVQAFAGQVVNVSLNMYPYAAAGSRGISCGLNAVMLTQNVGALGRLGNAVDAVAEFAGLFLTPEAVLDGVTSGAPVSDFQL